MATSVRFQGDKVHIPAMLVIGACCMFRFIESGIYFSLHIGALSSADIVFFTSTTLALFMTKNVYLKQWRQRQSTWGQHQIHALCCVHDCISDQSIRPCTEGGSP